jgi:exonuclease SbcC
MIPLTLQLKNFLSYGPEAQTIDFGHHRLICLNGKNGHGKSALLDAITWAVWGQARKTSGTSKADEHLLRLGQTFMSVTFDFICNGQTYRVKREYGKTFAKPYSSIEFGILDSNNVFHALTDKTIRTTQKKIEDTLGLDFDTFVNTAFLRQGQSHEFSQKSPKDRKNILANILSLQKFELLKKAALDKVKETAQKQTFLEQSQKSLSSEVEHKSTIEAQLSALMDEASTLDAQEKQREQTIAQYETEHKRLQTSLNQLELITLKIKDFTNNKHTAASELNALYATWRDVNQQQKRSLSTETIEKELKNLQSTISDHQKKLQTQLELKEQILKNKEKIQQRMQLLEADSHKIIEQQQKLIHECETSQKINAQTVESLKLQKTTLTQEIAALTKDIETALQQPVFDVKAFEAQEKQFDKRKRYFHEWTAQANQCALELKQLKQKNHMVSDLNNPSCPLCEQNLSASRKKFLKSHFDAQLFTSQSKIERFTRILTRLKQLLVEQHQQLSTTKTIYETYKTNQITLQHKQSELTQRSVKLSECLQLLEKASSESTLLNIRHKELSELKIKFSTEIREAINNDKELLSLKQQINAHEQQITSHVYNAIMHKQDMDRLHVLEKEREKLSHITKEVALQDQRHATIIEKIASIKEIKKTIAQLVEQTAEFSTIQEQSHKLIIQQESIKKEIAELRIAREKLMEHKGQLTAQLDKIKQQEQQLGSISKELTNIIAATADYQILGHALGKDGIQALLIEEALPEIEEEANNLLSQLTDNQAHITIESLRDLKSGGTKETLDIKISDPMGIRPYEMYSGGEAFRIDFALRIAISKLLAHRAGTSLQTLIIDEGFGSQDDEGLARIMECIYKIQDNFHKIIIVSHLPVMKDQFPVHFHIEKGANGSHVTVIEHG